jgi:LysM repeat protein
MKGMVSLLVVLLLIVFLSPQTVVAQTAQSTCGDIYLVLPEDTFSEIAQKCNVPYADLVAANPEIKNPNILYPGQVIHIPQGGRDQEIPVTGGSVYITQPGDTLAKIASRFQVSVDQLVQANLMLQPNSALMAGHVLTLPQGAARVPTFSVSPAFGQVGDSLTLAATGFRADVPIVVGLGETEQVYYQVLEAKTDANGALFQLFTLPDWVKTGALYRFVIQRADQPGIRSVSNAFTVQGAGSSIPVTGTFVYQVKAGDTLKGLTDRYHTTEATLLAINPSIGPARMIYPGQQIRMMGAPLPETGKPAVLVSLQTARPGDRLQMMGVHFPAGALVDVRLAQQGQTYASVVDSVANRAGVVIASISLPMFAQNNEQWVAIITTTDQSPSIRAVSQPVQIISEPHDGPWVGVSAVTAKPGEIMQVKAQNFPPNARVDVRAAQVGKGFTGVKDAQTDGKGALNSSIQIPETARAGERWVVIVTTTDRKNGVQATSQPILIAP